MEIFIVLLPLFMILLLFVGAPVAVIIAVLSVRRRYLDSEAAASRVACIENYIVGLQSQGFTEAFVTRRYQDGRQGAKVVLRFASGAQADAWFWWFHPEVGSLVYIQFKSGYGPHTGRDGVHYIGSKWDGHGVYGTVSSKEVRFLNRYRERRAALIRSASPTT